MSIYIPGMDMPKSHDEKIIIYSDGIAIRFDFCNGKTIESAQAVEVPPHGALKDADELRRYWMGVEERAGADTKLDGLTYHDVITEGCVFDLDNIAETIIPADPGEEEPT